jgi:mevalonate pyrophosphate decarboxylase
MRPASPSSQWAAKPGKSDEVSVMARLGSGSAAKA